MVTVKTSGVYQVLKKKWPKNIFGHGLCDLLALDEASQMNLPKVFMASLPLKSTPLVVIEVHPPADSGGCVGRYTCSASNRM